MQSCHSKVKKNKFPFHVLADNLLGEWSQRELLPSVTEILGD